MRRDAVDGMGSLSRVVWTELGIGYQGAVRMRTTKHLKQIKNAKRRSEATRRYPGSFAENSIYEINEMLKENGITPLGSDPDL